MGYRYNRRAHKRADKMREKKSVDKRTILKEIGKFALSIFIVIIAGYGIATFGFQTVKMIGQSMEPTIENGNTVIVNKAVYIVGKVKRYDVIAYKLRNENSDYYNIKRVIGLPGETVKIEDGHIFINGISLSDVPFEDSILTEGLAAEGVTLGDNEYFVIGDNCNNSEDSRFVNVGNIEDKEIKGKVVSVIWPWSDKRSIK